jgi:hypothetical protein
MTGGQLYHNFCETGQERVQKHAEKKRPDLRPTFPFTLTRPI